MWTWIKNNKTAFGALIGSGALALSAAYGFEIPAWAGELFKIVFGG